MGNEDEEYEDAKYHENAKQWGNTTISQGAVSTGYRTRQSLKGNRQGEKQFEEMLPL